MPRLELEEPARKRKRLERLVRINHQDEIPAADAPARKPDIKAPTIDSDLTARLNAFLPQMQASTQEHETMSAQYRAQLDAVVSKMLNEFRTRVRRLQEESRVKVAKKRSESQRRRKALEFRGELVKSKARTVHESSEINRARRDDRNTLSSRMDKLDKESDQVKDRGDGTKEMKAKLWRQQDKKIMAKITAKFERFKAARLERFQVEMRRSLARKEARDPNESSSPIVEMDLYLGVLEEKAQESDEDEGGAQINPNNILNQLLGEQMPKKQGIVELDSDDDDDDESSCASSSSAERSDSMSNSGGRRASSPPASSSHSDSSEWDEQWDEMGLDPVKAVEMELEIMAEILFNKYYEQYSDSEDGTDDNGDGSSK